MNDSDHTLVDAVVEQLQNCKPQTSPVFNYDNQNLSVEQLVNAVVEQTANNSTPEISPSFNVVNVLLSGEQSVSTVLLPQNRLASSPADVILKQTAAGLQASVSPFSAKHGLPHWFKGRVAAAFSTHIFYPEPPKKTKAGKLLPNQLFPACISTKKWRDMHVNKSNVRAKPQRRYVNGTQKVSLILLLCIFCLFLGCLLGWIYVQGMFSFRLVKMIIC